MQQRKITAEDAREFFLYHPDESIAASLEEFQGDEPGDIELIVDRGYQHDGTMFGGDILVGPKFQMKMLTEFQLIALARHMKIEEWKKPNTGPETFITR